MLAFRACAAAVRSGVLAVRSSVLPNCQISSGSTVGIHTSIAPYKGGLSTVPTLSGTASLNSGSGLLTGGYNNLLLNPTRSIMKIFWPRPRETKRLNKHGWKTRMSTPGGRRIIMRRILKGRHILSH